MITTRIALIIAAVLVVMAYKLERDARRDAAEAEDLLKEIRAYRDRLKKAAFEAWETLQKLQRIEAMSGKGEKEND